MRGGTNKSEVGKKGVFSTFVDGGWVGFVLCDVCFLMDKNFAKFCSL